MDCRKRHSDHFGLFRQFFRSLDYLQMYITYLWSKLDLNLNQVKTISFVKSFHLDLISISQILNFKISHWMQHSVVLTLIVLFLH